MGVDPRVRHRDFVVCAPPVCNRCTQVGRGTRPFKPRDVVSWLRNNLHRGISRGGGGSRERKNLNHTFKTSLK